MNAKLKKIQITPTKFDKDNNVQKEEFATLMIEVPMGSAEQYESIVKSLALLNREWVQVTMEGKNA